ncbi:MAG TPA: hypothetical protein VMP89_15575 [Solirubrobacteraceae bacterium]|nr:hypothetical protein [Solirubrobacteraceae bacterium]
MLGELITLPLRIGLGATRLWVRAAAEAVAVAGGAAGKLIDVAVSRRSVQGKDPYSLTPPSPPVADRRRAESRPTAAPVSPPPAPETRAAREPDAAHVSEEPVLVEEFAEPGAERGAGAELHVHEPWSGYDQLNAKDVIARLAVASPAELAAVQLYESTNRSRQTILTAVARQLRSANGGGLN